MFRLSVTGKYINYLIIAAVLLPLIFIGEVAYVERQYVVSNSQRQTEELAKLRTEAGTALLSNQAAYIRGVAKLNAVTTAESELMDTEFRSILDAKTGFSALGYAGIDGETLVEAGGTNGRYMGDRNYFLEAAAGREFIGETPGTDWLLGEEVVIVAMPVSVNGEINGVIYGVIQKETIEAMAAKLSPGTSVEQPALGRWLAWLGGVYLVGVIPLLLLAYLLRRRASAAIEPAASVGMRPVPSKERAMIAGNKQPINAKKMPAVAASKESAASNTKSLIETNQEITISKSTAPIPNTTPAAVIDRALATAAYKKVDKAPAPECIAGLPAHDTLTGLYTWFEFEKKIAAQQGQPNTGIVVVSIDGMKVINDYLGIEAGDAIIIATAEILKTVAGPNCTVARTDGDKFAAFLTGVSSDMFEDIKKDVKYYIDLHNLRQPELPLSITTGVAAAGQGESLQEVWTRADSDMESHKAVNRVEARKFIMLSIKRHRRRP